MKKISLIALLVLAGLLFAAPALRAQEAEQTEAQKKAKAVADLEDDEQLGNFLASLSPEELADLVTAVVESGDAGLIDRVNNVLQGMGTDINSAMNPQAAAAGESAAAGEEAAAGDSEGADQVSDKATEIANALLSNFGDASTMLDGDDFNTSNPLANTASLSMPEAE